MERSYSVEQLITGFYVKYNKLSELILQSYSGSSCEEINIFIDLNSVLRPMYSGDIWTHRSVSKLDIASSIINMCGHYRSFFRNLHVKSNIYLIYGLNCPEANEVYMKGYNSKFLLSYIKKPDITNAIEENLRYVEILCQYLPNIYFFNIGKCEVSSMIDRLITHNPKSLNGIENIIISKDVVMLQLIPEHNVRVIRPLKTKDGDMSFIVDNNNLWRLFHIWYHKAKFSQDIISTKFFQNILPMTSIPERSIYAIFSINKAITLIKQCVDNGYLDNDKFYIQSGLNTALSTLGVEFNPALLEMRFKAVNAHYQSTFILTLEKPEFTVLRLVDLEDIPSLKEIVAKYFASNPIDLDRLY